MGCQGMCPSVTCPKLEYPTYNCPSLDCPNISVAGVKCGDVTVGSLHCPTINFPGIKCEQITCPNIQYPTFNCPSIKCTDPTLNCPACFDNSLGIIIMVTVIASLALLFLFIYKFKQSHDRNKIYRDSNRIRREELERSGQGLIGKCAGSKSSGIELKATRVKSKRGQTHVETIDPVRIQEVGCGQQYGNGSVSGESRMMNPDQGEYYEVGGPATSYTSHQAPIIDLLQ